MAKKRTKRGYHIRETGTRFTMGITFSPSRRDLRVVLTKMKDYGIVDAFEPAIGVDEALGNDAACRYLVKDLLESAAHKEYPQLNVEPDVVQGLLWVLACYNYKWYNGPIPSGPPRRKYPRRVPITAFRCPYCGQEFVPNPRYKSRVVILKQFSKWLYQHADANIIYLGKGVK